MPKYGAAPSYNPDCLKDYVPTEKFPASMTVEAELRNHTPIDQIIASVQTTCDASGFTDMKPRDDAGSYVRRNMAGIQRDIDTGRASTVNGISNGVESNGNGVLQGTVIGFYGGGCFVTAEYHGRKQRIRVPIGAAKIPGGVREGLEVRVAITQEARSGHSEPFGKFVLAGALH